MTENLPNLSVIFPDSWFSDHTNAVHPLFAMASDARDPSLLNLQVIDTELGKLRQLGLLQNKRLRIYLQNPTQFLNTFSEIHVALHLARKGFKPNWGRKNGPDIVISELETDIEVKNLKDSKKFGDPGDYAPEIDDQYRIEDMLAMKKIIHRLDVHRVNLVVVGVVSIGVDEFEDLFLFSNQYHINPETKSMIRYFDGLFSSEKYKSLSAIVMMKDPFERWLNPWRRKETRPGEPEFSGLSNPRCAREVPGNLKDAFRIFDTLSLRAK